MQWSIAKNVANARGLARYVAPSLHRNVSVPGLVSAIKRYPAEGARNRIANVETIISEARVGTRMRIMAFELRKDATAYGMIARLFNSVDVTQGEAIRVIQGEKSIMVVVDQTNQASAMQILPKNVVLSSQQNLAELSIRLREDAYGAPGAIFMLTSALFAKGISIWGVLAAPSEILVLIHERDLAGAHQQMIGLIEGCKVSLTSSGSGSQRNGNGHDSE